MIKKHIKNFFTMIFIGAKKPKAKQSTTVKEKCKDVNLDSDEELVAVITAAISAILCEGGGEQMTLPFRVKRIIPCNH